MRSLSEIETVSKRASKAAGFSWGVSEEIGKGVRLLELFGLPGIQTLNQYFVSKKKKEYENLKAINIVNETNQLELCPISVGLIFLDKIKTLEKTSNFRFQNIAYPLLLLPFLSRGSEIIGKKILFRFDDNEFILNFNICILYNSLNKNFNLNAKIIDVSFLDNKDNFNDLDWKNLYKFSEETFVEETDILKNEAAGAGVTDND
tara:strand:+ start:210 stop:821 length:612 start_codon:yes stop_codon:yes gene_type:complete